MNLKLNLLNVMGNLIGASLTFLYFSYVSVGAGSIPQGGPSIYYFIYFIIGMGLIFLVLVTALNRWSRPLDEFSRKKISISDLDEPSAERIKRKALQCVPMMAGASLIGWIMAGFIFGMLMPVIMEIFFEMPPTTLGESMGRIFGITCIGGSITALFIYFSTESVWRKELPNFFPEGNLSQVRGAFKLNVKVRLSVVFLMISLLPLTVLGVSAYCKAQALLVCRPYKGRADHFRVIASDHLYHWDRCCHFSCTVVLCLQKCFRSAKGDGNGHEGGGGREPGCSYPGCFKR